MATTQLVLEHHLQCFGSADVEGIMTDYVADSVMLTPQGTLRGPAMIRSFFDAAFAEFSKPGTTFEMKQVLVDGDCAFIAWDAETVDNRYEAATDTFVVRDGKILVQTFGAKITPKR